MPLLSRRNPVDASSLFEMHVALRDGTGCTRRHRLSDALRASLTSCTQGCQNFLGACHNRITRRVAISLLFVLTLLHPVLHAFEGGALDALMVGLMARVSLDD